MRVVLARHYGGFAAVDAMTWQEFALARELEAQIAVGAPMRQAKEIEKQQARQARMNRGAR